jgi:hypothetical protein
MKTSQGHEDIFPEQAPDPVDDMSDPRIALPQNKKSLNPSSAFCHRDCCYRQSTNRETKV